MTLPVSILTPLVSRVTEAFLNAATSDASRNISFEIGDRDMMNFCNAFMLQFSHFDLGLSVFQPPVFSSDIEPLDPPTGFCRHVAVLGDRKAVDSKKEYKLFYGNSPVTARLYLVKSGTKEKWRLSDRKWYMVD